MKVLIVDDIPANRTILEFVFKGFEGLDSIDQAENGEEAYLMAESNVYDLILMDLMMPIMDGVQAIEKIRNGSGVSKNSIILAVTASRDPELHSRASLVGANSIITKPFKKAELLELVRALLSE
jgi:CheY-like chemotaxis protein